MMCLEQGSFFITVTKIGSFFVILVLRIARNSFLASVTHHDSLGETSISFGLSFLAHFPWHSLLS